MTISASIYSTPNFVLPLFMSHNMYFSSPYNHCQNLHYHQQRQCSGSVHAKPLSPPRQGSNSNVVVSPPPSSSSSSHAFLPARMLPKGPGGSAVPPPSFQQKDDSDSIDDILESLWPRSPATSSTLDCFPPQTLSSTSLAQPSDTATTTTTTNNNNTNGSGGGPPNSYGLTGRDCYDHHLPTPGLRRLSEQSPSYYTQQQQQQQQQQYQPSAPLNPPRHHHSYPQLGLPNGGNDLHANLSIRRSRSLALNDLAARAVARRCLHSNVNPSEFLNMPPQLVNNLRSSSSELSMTAQHQQQHHHLPPMRMRTSPPGLNQQQHQQQQQHQSVGEVGDRGFQPKHRAASLGYALYLQSTRKVPTFDLGTSTTAVYPATSCDAPTHPPTVAGYSDSHGTYDQIPYK